MGMSHFLRRLLGFFQAVITTFLNLKLNLSIVSSVRGSEVEFINELLWNIADFDSDVFWMI
jgi:hypothetical protein